MSASPMLGKLVVRSVERKVAYWAGYSVVSTVVKKVDKMVA
jgi:hypothetical protein